MARNKKVNPFANTGGSAANTPATPPPANTIPRDCPPAECGTVTGPFPEPTYSSSGGTTTGPFPSPPFPQRTGSTGTTTSSTPGLPAIGVSNQILGVNATGTTLEYKTLVAGSNITITNVPGQIIIASTGGAAGGTGTVTSVSIISSTLYIAGSPITRSGTIDIELQTTGVTAGTYTTANIDVDQYGRIIDASNGSGGGEKLYAENPQSGYVPPTAIGSNSVALGEAAIAGADDSLAIGEQSYSRITGGVVQASGRFASSGDAQVGRYMVRAITNGATPVQGYVDGPGGSINLVLLDNSTWTFRIMVTAQRTDMQNGRAGFELKGVIYRLDGPTSVAMQGVITREVYSTNNPAWTTVASADPVNGSLDITFQGESGKNIRWVALVETVEVSN